MTKFSGIPSGISGRTETSASASPRREIAGCSGMARQELSGVDEMRKILILSTAALMDPLILEAIARKREQLEVQEPIVVREETFMLRNYSMPPEIEDYCVESKQQSWQEKVAPAALLRKPKRSR